jgi:hypothetical protein
MQQTVDLTRISLPEYAALLKARRLTAGRLPLLTDIDARFAAMQRNGANTIAALLDALATPKKLAAFAAQTGVDEAYLTLLRREASGLIPRPVPLADLPGVDEARVAALRAQGVITTGDYRQAVPPGDVLLDGLCALTRINGIGPLAARAFYEAGYRTVQAVAQANAETMLARVTAANDALGLYRGKLGVQDMRFCIEGAALLLRCGG